LGFPGPRTHRCWRHDRQKPPRAGHPKQIAAAAVEAAKAGATVVHCHVRDPDTGKFSRDVALYREVMERIGEADVDIIVNLTAGMGGDLQAAKRPMEFGPNTDLVGPLTRLAHVEELPKTPKPLKKCNNNSLAG